MVVSGQLTGRHVLAWLGAFFAVMFVANVALIYFALHTLHGSELENSYDASQAFNRRIAEARAQDERGWKADVLTRAEGPGERVMVEFRDRSRRADFRSRPSRRVSSIRSTPRRTAGDRSPPTASTTKGSRPRSRPDAGPW